MTGKMVPLSVPNISGNEWKYVKDCLDTGWISSAGSYVTQFEEMVADYTGTKYGIAVVNGTAALHICMLLNGVEAGDYVIIPNLTFVATANAVTYLGAEPILIDVEKGNWQMDLGVLEEFLLSKTIQRDGACLHVETGRVVRALMPVHVLGNICDIDRLMSIAQEHSLVVLEDSTEALGSTYNNRSAGSFGAMGCFSFNGNKIISTGGGGVIVTDIEDLAMRAKHLTTQAKPKNDTYYHDMVGYNYRLVNILAAVGVAQMEQLDEFVLRKREIMHYYQSELIDVGDITFQEVSEDVYNNGWLFTIHTERQKDLLEQLNKSNLISRPFWVPMNQLPMFSQCIYANTRDMSDHIYSSSLSIPGSTGISNEDLELVVKEIKRFFS